MRTITKYQKINAYLSFQMGVSFLGLFLVGMLAIHPVVGDSPSWRKPLVGLIFGSICILGSLAALFPKKCLEALHFKKEDTPLNKYSDSKERNLDSYRVRFAAFGHHPNCGSFSAHVFRIGRRTFCTSCTGLLFGALISLIATILYFSGYWQIGQKSIPIVYFGILGVSLGLIQFPLFKNRRSFLRFLFNSFFVFGAFLILVGFDKLAHSVAFDLFLILLIIFWIFTRIILSQWDHRRICYACNNTSCELRMSSASAAKIITISNQKISNSSSRNLMENLKYGTMEPSRNIFYFIVSIVIHYFFVF